MFRPNPTFSCKEGLSQYYQLEEHIYSLEPPASLLVGKPNVRVLLHLGPLHFLHNAFSVGRAYVELLPRRDHPR